MRKGDAKRQEMLNAAEKLFCSKGYEATSVQDILNVLHASKGGFYHHFASKEDVLKTLCAQRADRVAAYTQELLDNAGGDMARINIVLHGFMPMRREEVAFVNMMLPLIKQPEGKAMAMAYQEALSESFQPLLSMELSDARDHGTICPPVREIASVVLHLINRCWMDMAELMLQVTRKGLRYDTAALLSILERYRRSVEVLLDAPYGSIEIIRIEEWEEIAQRLLRTLDS